MVLSDKFDEADDVRVELAEVLGWDPVLEDRAAADLVDVIAVQE